MHNLRLIGLMLIAMSLCAANLSAQEGFRISSHQIYSLSESLPIDHQQDFGSWTWLSGGKELAAALSAAGIEFEHFPEAGMIQVHQHRFDPLQVAPKGNTAPRDEDERLLGLVQFHGPLTRSDLAEISQLGLVPLQYYPHNAYLVWGSHQALAAASNARNIRAVSEFASDWRLHPELMRFSGQIRNINLHFVNSGRIEDFLARVAALGGEVLDAWPAQPDGRLWDVKITLPAERLSRLEGLPELISANYMSPEVFFDDESGAQVIAGNLNQTNAPSPGYSGWLGDVGLTGQGVIWSVTDSGIWYTHGDYAGRIVGGANYPGCDLANPGDERPSGGGHGTHVAGIIAGNGAAGFIDSDGFLYGLGVAPEASLFAQNPICGGQASWPPAGGWPVLSRDAVRGGAIGSNNSWTSGEGTAHGYQNSERTYDLMVLDGDFETPELSPFIVVFSAGNSGSGANTLTAPKEAKNPIVTASTQTFRVSGNVDQISGFSSRGPTVDGRISPTIAAPGQSVSSTMKPNATSCGTAITGTSGQYSFCSGTSMAAPHASGALVLLAEWWRGFNQDEDFSPAMAKALLVSGARRINTNGQPDFNSGFGRVDLGPLVNGEIAYEFWDQTDLLTESGQQWTRQVGTVDPDRPLKITLTWSDAPGAIGANPAIVNDLDLVVTTAGQTWRGNNFNGFFSAPGGTADRLNNIEQVWIENPGNTVTITIDAFQVAGNVLLNGAGPAQHFALVCENCTENPNFALSLNDDPLAVCLPDSVETTIQVASIAGFDDPVDLSLGALPSGVTGTLSVNQVTPPGTSGLSFSISADAAPGFHDYAIDAVSTTGLQVLNGTLNLFDQAPGSPTLQIPVDQAVNVPGNAQFSWSSASQAGSYRLEVASDPAFENIDFSMETTDTTAMVSGLVTSSTYYYRVVVINACGERTSNVFSFSTEAQPGDCAIGTVTQLLMTEGFETGFPSGWTSDGTASTWTRSNTQSASGSWSMHAANTATVSDQRLSTPAVSLPGGATGLFLDFQNRQVMESRSGGCWDGGIIEISSDNGTSWTQVSNQQLINRAYDGEIGSGFSNPLVGRQAWCGDPRSWENYIVDLSDWAGQTVRFRFRLGTDSSVGREGWYLDDVQVRACQISNIFQDRFQGP